MEDRRPTYLSLFTGIGGFDLALDRVGWRCVGQCEIDDFCTRVLERHWPDTPRWRDIRHLGTADVRPPGGDESGGRLPGGGDIRNLALPHAAGEQQPVGAASPDSVDLITAGFPCQDLSVAGRRAGLAGPRSGLFYELVRVARELRPRWLLLENVPGLLSSSGGDDFRAVLAALGDCGYGVGWRVLDARWFGVPQRRRRVFLVGRLGAPCPPEVLALSEGLQRDPAAGTEAGADVAGSLTGGTERRGWRVGADEGARAPSHGRQLVAAPLEGGGSGYQGDRVFAPGEPFGALGTSAGGAHRGNAGRSSGFVLDTAYALNAHPGPSRRLDGESETFVIQADAYSRSGDGAYRQPGLGVRADDQSYTLDATKPHAVAFYNNAGSQGMGDTRDIAPPLKVGTGLAGGPPAAVAVALSAGTLNGEALGDEAAPLVSGDGPHGRSTHNGLDTFVSGAAVRRLTPTECERLMALPDGWTCLCGVEPYSTWDCRCPDGPRYGACGNGVVTNVVAWIGERLLAAHEAGR